MIGLMYLVFFAVYLLVSVAAVRGAIGYARKNGKSAKRWGWGAAFVMYSLVFWDWIPTVAVHQYYCAKDSGFWVYKTLDQWKAENPGVAETLVANKNSPYKSEQFDDGYGTTKTYFLNERFTWSITKQDMFGLLPIVREEQLVRDVAKNEVLARYVDFWTGNSIEHFVSMPYKFW
ncbi:MAG: hypothetical protein ABI144_09505, partial [Gallionella sp.]